MVVIFLPHQQLLKLQRMALRLCTSLKDGTVVSATSGDKALVVAGLALVASSQTVDDVSDDAERVEPFHLLDICAAAVHQ